MGRHLFDEIVLEHISWEANHPEELFQVIQKILLHFLQAKGIMLEEISGTQTGLLLYSKSIAEQPIFDFINRLKKSEYRGLVPPQLFQYTPLNALASSLSILLSIQGPVLHFSDSEKGLNELLAYGDHLKQSGTVTNCIVMGVEMFSFPNYNHSMSGTDHSKQTVKVRIDFT